MAKRVLGNDPFSDGTKDEAPSKNTTSGSKRPSLPPAKGASAKQGAKSEPPKARPSKPPARPSVRPSAAPAKPSVRPSAAPAKPSVRPSAAPPKAAAKTSAPPAKPSVRPSAMSSKPASRPSAAPSKPAPRASEAPATTASQPAEAPTANAGPVTPRDIHEEVTTKIAVPVVVDSFVDAAGPVDPVRIIPQAPPPSFETDLGATLEHDDRGVDDESIAAADLPPDLSREPAHATHSEPETPRTQSAGDVKADIRTIEAEIDRLLDTVGDRGADRATLDRVAARLREKMGEEKAPSEPPESAGVAVRDDVFDVARELLSSDYYRQQWGRVAMRDRAEEVDDFGLDPKYAARVRPFFDFLYERWWRVETHDIDRVPADGRVILCANHSGALPYDGAMLATAIRREHPQRRDLRWLAEDFIFHFPFLGVFMNRIGAVRACQENAERLLRKDACVGVFPEGVKGISKLYRDRYKLQRFGRGGHVKLAIRTKTPIVPVAILGAEEAHPLIAPTSILAKALGVPFVPITPTFPWFGPLGLVPVPSKWKIFFLEPITMDGYSEDAADDEVLVGRLNEKIRGQIQDELDRAVKSRASVLRG